MANLSYKTIRVPLRFWRSKSEEFVDFIIRDHIAIEVKSGKKVTHHDHKGLAMTMAQAIEESQQALEAVERQETIKALIVPA